MNRLDTLAASINEATLAELESGKRVAVSDHFMDWAEARSMSIRTIPNPDRVGINDRYVAWIAKAVGGQ